MSMRFRADNIGSLLGPAELLQARADYGEERIDLNELRQVEDRAILMALNMQRATGIEVFTTANIAAACSPPISLRRWKDLFASHCCVLKQCHERLKFFIALFGKRRWGFHPTKSMVGPTEIRPVFETCTPPAQSDGQ
jgi:hypothetical protein